MSSKLHENSKLVSIVIPIYNVEKYLRCCLNSVVNQTYPNLEIILVDDGSTDNCSKICDEYAQRDRRIVIIHKTNGGLSDARNRGIELATGKYITFIDSDDCVALNYIEMLICLMDKDNADIAICSRKDVSETFEEYDSIVGCNENTVVLDNVSCIKESYLGRYHGINATAWGKMYKTSLFCDNSITYPVGELHEDIYTTYKLFYYATKIVYFDAELYYYRHRNGSIMNDAYNRFEPRNMRVSRATEETISFYFSKNEMELVPLAINYHIRLLFGLNYKMRKSVCLSISEKKKYNQEMKSSVLFYLKYGYLSWYKQLIYAFVARFPSAFLLKMLGA